jgi:hypothetical protein
VSFRDTLRRGLVPAAAPLPAPKAPAASIVWTPKQEQALDALDVWWTTSREPAFVLGGLGGSGKTTLLLAAAASWRRAAVRYTAMSGRAALRFYEATGFPATTLHAPLYMRPRPARGSGRSS